MLDMFGSQAIPQPVICPPKDITLYQARLIVEKYMRDHPEDLRSSAQEIVFAAFELAFPCNKFAPLMTR